MTSASTNFSPPVNGFQFVNRFDVPDLLNINLPLVAPKKVSDIVYGLCGGMCCAAVDYYQDHRQPPGENQPDNISYKLFLYLCKRQVDTLSLPVLEKIFTWIILDPATLAKKVAMEEAPAVMHSIDAGTPAVLVLIRSHGLTEVTQNHQVLAIGYDSIPGQNLAIRLYDPNHPGEIPELTMNLSHPDQGIQLAQSTHEPLFGFFTIPYQHASPP